jgi:hypothetical protein
MSSVLTHRSRWGGAWRGASRATRVGVVMAVLLLTVGPIAVTLLRAESYTSATTISLTASAERAGVEPPNPRTFLTEALSLRDLQRGVAREVGWFDAPTDLPEHVSVRPRREPDGYTYRVTARAPRPEEAQELARAVAARLIAAGERGADFAQPLALARARRALASDGLAQGERRTLRRRAQLLARGDVQFFAPVASPATLAKERWLDRVVAVAPGDAIRPNALWVALAGLVLAAAVALAAFSLGPAGRRGAQL